MSELLFKVGYFVDLLDFFPSQDDSQDRHIFLFEKSNHFPSTLIHPILASKMTWTLPIVHFHY